MSALSQFYRNKGYGNAFTKEDKLRAKVKAEVEENPLKIRPNTTDEFEYNQGGVDLTGYFLNAVCHKASFVVLAGSKGVVTPPKKAYAHMMIHGPSYQALREELINAAILVEDNGRYVLMQDYCFNSSSAAIAVLAGETFFGSGQLFCKRTGQTFREVQY